MTQVQLDGLMMSKNKFTKMVEETVRYKKITYIDAVVHLCEENKIEIEDIKKYISLPIKNKIEAEAMTMNCLTANKGNTLPIE